MRTHRIVPIAALGAFLAVSLAAHPALAQSTAVVPFEGRRASIVRRLVSRAIRRDADLVSRRTVDGAAGDAGVEGLGEAGVSTLADAVGADLVLQGSISGRSRRPRIELVFRAADGTELTRGEVQYSRSRRGRRRFRSGVQRLYQDAVTALEAHRAAPPPEPEPPPEPVAPPEPETPEPPPPEVPEDGLALFSATAGVTVRTRAATVELEGGGRRRYELASGAYPELLVAVEARPFANDAHLGRGLFVRGLFAHSVGLGSETMGGGTSVDTNFVRFGFHAGWLAPLGEVAELGASVGGGYEGYHLAANVVMPTAEYAWLRLGARGRIRPLEDETVVIEAAVAYRPILGVGPLRDAFGVDGDSHGVDVGVGVGGNLIAVADLGLTWGVRFDYVGYFTSYDGAASDASATSGSEESVRFTLLAGWSFR